MEQSEFVSHCESLHQRHFAGEARMSPQWPFIRKNVRSYYGKAKKYGSGWQVKIAHKTLSLPDWVRDYIICHEIAHCIDDTRSYGTMHTSEYWALLRAAYPRTDEAERWLRRQDRRRPSTVLGPNAELKRKYPVGTYVNYADGRGGDHVGTITRHNAKTMTISNDEDGGWWRIPWSLVEMAIIDIL